MKLMWLSLINGHSVSLNEFITLSGGDTEKWCPCFWSYLAPNCPQEPFPFPICPLWGVSAKPAGSTKLYLSMAAFTPTLTSPTEVFLILLRTKILQSLQLPYQSCESLWVGSYAGGSFEDSRSLTLECQHYISGHSPPHWVPSSNSSPSQWPWRRRQCVSESNPVVTGMDTNQSERTQVTVLKQGH